jgi:alpha-tubulin suppressor-like RCC1 family protein
MIKKTVSFTLLAILLFTAASCELTDDDHLIDINEDFKTEYEVGSTEPDWSDAIVLKEDLSVDDLSIDASDVDFDTPGTYDIVFSMFQEEPLTLTIEVIRDYVIDFSIGHSHVLAVTYFAKIYAWGNNAFGQLGNGQTGIDAFAATPLEVSESFDLHENERIVRVFTGQDHSFALSNDDRLFSWGMNWSGQLGDGTDDNHAIPQDITMNLGLAENERILDLQSDYHSIVLTSDDRLLSFGWNEYGQLANGASGHSSEETLPIDVTNSFTFEDHDAIASIRINRVLTENGRVFAWGENDKGQVGDDTDENRPFPVDTTATYPLLEGETIQSFSDTGMIALTESRVLALGIKKSLGGNLSVESIVDDITDQFELEDDDVIKRVKNASHILALSAHGRLYAWGQNTYGELGIDGIDHSLNPIDITDSIPTDEGEAIAKVEAGTNGFSILLTSSGRLFAWGRNNFGQLGIGTQEDTSTPSLIVFE